MSRGLHNLYHRALMEKLREKPSSLTTHRPFFRGCGGMVDAADLKSVDRIGRESSSLSTPIFQPSGDSLQLNWTNFGQNFSPVLSASCILGKPQNYALAFSLTETALGLTACSGFED